MLKISPFQKEILLIHRFNDTDVNKPSDLKTRRHQIYVRVIGIYSRPRTRSESV